MQAEFRFGEQTPDKVTRRQNEEAAEWRRKVELMGPEERHYERTHGLPEAKAHETPSGISLTAPYVTFIPPAH